MADGFAFVLHFEGVPAVFASREPGWDDEVEGECEVDRPLDDSLFEPPT